MLSLVQLRFVAFFNVLQKYGFEDATLSAPPCDATRTKACQSIAHAVLRFMLRSVGNASFLLGLCLIVY